MSKNVFIPENGIAGKFVSCSKDENGCLTGIQFNNDENFNFAFDVVDALAKKCPNKTAMLHISKAGRERNITFKDMSLYSSKVANYLSYLRV